MTVNLETDDDDGGDDDAVDWLCTNRYVAPTIIVIR